MTGKRISSNDERKMTAAIERAATLASADAGKNRDKLLADCLMEGGVDSRFAKAASAGFNKRVSVLTFQKASDDDRANSFQLTDADRVEELMGAGARGQAKAAAFTAAVAPAPSAGMSKAASAKPATARVNYEDRVTADVLERHLVSVMQKLAAEHSSLLSELNVLQAAAGKLAKVASAALRALPDGQAEAVRSRLGSRLTDAVPGSEERRKAFPDAIVADTPEIRKIAAAVEARERYVDANDAMAELQAGLSKFAADADAVGSAMHKLGAANPLGLAGTSYMLMKGIGDTGLGGVAMLNQVRQGMIDNLGTAYGAALSLNNYDRDNMAPSKILDSEFLTKDRARDRVLAFSDMSADPLLSRQATASQLFAATNKAIDLDPRLERPDQRELLRVYVAKLLAQNGRMDDAGMAALSSIEGQLGKAPATLDEVAAEPVYDMAKVEAPELPASDLGKLVSIMGAGADKLKDTLDLSTLEKSIKVKEDSDKRKGSKEDADEKQNKAKAEQLKAEKEQRAAVLKALGVNIGMRGNQVQRQLGHGANARALSKTDLKNMVKEYNNLFGTEVSI